MSTRPTHCSFVYGLLRKSDNAMIYIGQTRNPIARLSAHGSKRRNLSDPFNDNFYLVILDGTDCGNANHLQNLEIRRWKEAGHPIENKHEACHCAYCRGEKFVTPFVSRFPDIRTPVFKAK